MGENRVQKRAEGAAVHQAGGLDLETRGQKVKVVWQELVGAGGKPSVFHQGLGILMR